MYDSNNKLLFNFLPSRKSKILSSISYLIRADSGYNYRLSFSSGYRNPSIKELYYEWTDHEPNIYGNPDLLSTRNNYFSKVFVTLLFIVYRQYRSNFKAHY